MYLKIFFVASLLPLCILSCKKNEAVSSKELTRRDTMAKTEAKVAGYQPIDTVCSPGNKTEDYINALEWYKSKIQKETNENSPEQNNKVYENYIKISSKYITCLNTLHSDLLDQYVTYYDDKINGYKFPESIKKLAAELKKGGLEFQEQGEGITEIGTIPSYYYSIFKNKVTPDYNRYISQIAKESEVSYAADAGLIITWEELGERLILWENFMNKYPKSTLIQTVKRAYDSYLADYFFGMDNTPSSENGKLYDENRAEYQRLIKKYPNSYTAKKAKELLSLFDAQIPLDQIHEKINIESN